MDTWHGRLDRLLKDRSNADESFTRAFVAERVGVKAASVSDWCTGKTKEIIGRHLITLCDFLEIDPHWLIFGKGKKQQSKAEIMEQRHRLCATNDEIGLLQIYREMTQDGKIRLMAKAEILHEEYPAQSNVVAISAHRKERKKKR